MGGAPPPPLDFAPEGVRKSQIFGPPRINVQKGGWGANAHYPNEGIARRVHLRGELDRGSRSDSAREARETPRWWSPTPAIPPLGSPKVSERGGVAPSVTDVRGLGRDQPPTDHP